MKRFRRLIESLDGFYSLSVFHDSGIDSGLCCQELVHHLRPFPARGEERPKPVKEELWMRAPCASPEERGVLLRRRERRSELLFREDGGLRRTPDAPRSRLWPSPVHLCSYHWSNQEVIVSFSPRVQAGHRRVSRKLLDERGHKHRWEGWRWGCKRRG